ncbi:MAG: glycosyltransferase family 2 protein, partial [Gemmatimonadaceae bacterium]|nr:glycosyltransferase family 2 protein [Gloeobacterales cyanobacterium ES-bin-141]
MPTFNRSTFIRRALESLRLQSLSNWELLIVDDGSSDGTPRVITPYLDDSRIHYYRLSSNGGFGAALNYALERASAPFIAYLPSDDVYYKGHLASLAECFQYPDAVLAYSGLRHHQHQLATGQIEGKSLQLVQVMHRSGSERWVERDELVTDDLERLFWSQHRKRGKWVGTAQVSCEWVNHPKQHHKIVLEPCGGGINPYRGYYSVKQPLRFHSSAGNYTDEVAHYRQFRERPDTPPTADGLKILLVGELAYNPERVLALEERGHKLYGLWTEDPWWFNTVGPLPFGHVEDLPRSGWREAVRQIKPDLIYALLNWQAVPFVHRVLNDNPGIPFVWHFKEGPWLCLENGSWSQLIDLHTRSDAQIYSSPEQRDWFTRVIPGCAEGLTLVLDGDLPKREWFTSDRSPRLSEADGQFHTVIPGRPIGLHPSALGELAQQGIHLHFYGDVNHAGWRPWIQEAQAVAPAHLHLHSHVSQGQWVSELSRYDAGWLHFLKSENEGDLSRANWDDLNYPARIATIVAAGLPLLQYDNRDAIVATQSLVRSLDIGLFCTDMSQLGTQLGDAARMTRLRDNVWRVREKFTFDYHADRLIDF